MNAASARAALTGLDGVVRVSELPAINVVSVRLTVDADAFPIADLETGHQIGGANTMWVCAALRLDGDLPARLRERARAWRDAPAAQQQALLCVSRDDPRIAAQLRVLAALRELVRQARGN